MAHQELIIDVKLWENKVGSLFWNEENGTALFQYEPKFLESGLEVSPLIMSLRQSSKDRVYEFLGNRNDCFKGLPSMIADSLPDNYGTQIINEWFTSKGLPIERITPLDQLSYIGKRGMGALEFEPTQRIKGLDASSLLHIEELRELADLVFKDRSEFRDKLLRQDKATLDILKVGTSAGGAKPKAIIAYNERTNEVRSGQVQAPEGFSYWILKFDGTTYLENNRITDTPKGYGNIEYAYYKMAIDCGIRMSESRLLRENDSCHFMTRRYDRLENGDKIHVQTLAAIGNLDRNTRHSYEEGFGILRKMGMNYPDHVEFFRRMVFNVVARNHDDHTKNHAFLMDRSGKWALAPAYDICFSYSPGGRWTNTHQMSLNGKVDDFTYHDLIQVGKNMDINNPKAQIENIVEIVSRWKDYAKDCGVRENYSKYIESNMLLLTKGQYY